MTDTRNATEREFDQLVIDELEKPPGEWAGMASPDGLGEGTGRWTIYHTCAEPDIHNLGARIVCHGCGQICTYKASRG